MSEPAILILYDKGQIKVDMFGKEDPYFHFDVDSEISLDGTCSVTFNNRFFIYGSREEGYTRNVTCTVIHLTYTANVSLNLKLISSSLSERQIVELVGCSLKKSSKTLTFKHGLGGCTVARNKIYFGFGDDEKDRTSYHKSDHPTDGPFIPIKKTDYAHYNIRLISSESMTLFFIMISSLSKTKWSLPGQELTVLLKFITLIREIGEKLSHIHLVRKTLI